MTTDVKNADFTTTIMVDQTPELVFDAINNVRGWWSGEVEGNTNQLNAGFTYRYKDIHFSKQRITELIPGRKITWLVTDSKISFVEDKNEWTGTTISFDISEQDSKTYIRFTHRGLNSAVECFNDCSNAWSQLIRTSLYSLITTGRSKEIF